MPAETRAVTASAVISPSKSGRDVGLGLPDRVRVPVVVAAAADVAPVEITEPSAG